MADLNYEIAGLDMIGIYNRKLPSSLSCFSIMSVKILLEHGNQFYKGHVNQGILNLKTAAY